MGKFDFTPHKDFVLVEQKDGHFWGVYKDDKYQTCRLCGFIRPIGDTKKSCKGKPELRL